MGFFDFFKKVEIVECQDDKEVLLLLHAIEENGAVNLSPNQPYQQKHHGYSSMRYRNDRAEYFFESKNYDFILTLKISTWNDVTTWDMEVITNRNWNSNTTRYALNCSYERMKDVAIYATELYKKLGDNATIRNTGQYRDVCIRTREEFLESLPDYLLYR